MITIEQWKMGRDKQYPSEFTKDIESNAIALIEKVNNLIKDLKYEKKLSVSSGWRPSAVNAATPNAAKKSHHQTGHAVDLLDDKDQTIGNLCKNNVALLMEHGLYLEDISSTKGKYTNWVHLQDVAPKSGKIIFKP
jgi:hypothetical protein